MQEGEGGNLALANFSIGGCDAAGEPQRVRDTEGDPTLLSSLGSSLLCPWHRSNALPKEPVIFAFSSFLASYFYLVVEPKCQEETFSFRIFLL